MIKIRNTKLGYRPSLDNHPHETAVPAVTTENTEVIETPKTTGESVGATEKES